MRVGNPRLVGSILDHRSDLVRMRLVDGVACPIYFGGVAMSSLGVPTFEVGIDDLVRFATSIQLGFDLQAGVVIFPVNTVAAVSICD